MARCNCRTARMNRSCLRFNPTAFSNMFNTCNRCCNGGGGTVGPAGPMGPAGPAGPAGPTGPAGTCDATCVAQMAAMQAILTQLTNINQGFINEAMAATDPATNQPYLPSGTTVANITPDQIAKLTAFLAGLGTYPPY